jgi:hypothetical protein
MERFVLTLYGLWFWLTRDYRATHYCEAASTLHSAHAYLLKDFANRASTRDRGTLLPHQMEALAILEQHGTLIDRTSRRFASLSECCRFVTEELTQPEPLPAMRSYGLVPSVLFLTPSASGVTTGVAAPINSTRLLPS